MKENESRKDYAVHKCSINGYILDILHHSKYKLLICKFIYWL